MLGPWDLKQEHGQLLIIQKERGQDIGEGSAWQVREEAEAHEGSLELLLFSR